MTQVKRYVLLADGGSQPSFHETKKEAIEQANQILFTRQASTTFIGVLIQRMEAKISTEVIDIDKRLKAWKTLTIRDNNEAALSGSVLLSNNAKPVDPNGEDYLHF
jgi:hypothetical protein